MTPIEMTQLNDITPDQTSRATKNAKRKKLAQKEEVLSLKTDMMGQSTVAILNDARVAKRMMLANEETKQALHDYVWGKSDENPFQEINDYVNGRLNGYEEKTQNILKELAMFK